jgi:phosphocarrier protein
MSIAHQDITITNPAGIHARPASEFTKAASASGATVTVSTQGNEPVDARSILSVMSLGLKKGDIVRVTVDGEGAESIAQHLAQVIANSQ